MWGNPVFGVIAVVVMLVSCGTSGSVNAGPDGGLSAIGPPIALTDLCPVFTKDLCTYLLQCDQAPYRDMNHCLAEVDCYGLPQLTAAGAQGAVNYDPAAVGDCSARFLSDPCHFASFLETPDIFEVLAYCPGAIAPQLQAGAACDSSGECLAGLACAKNGDACPGTCAPVPVAGSPCPPNDYCGQGDLFCDHGGSTTQSGVCRPNAKEGDSCTVDEDCGPLILCLGDPCANLNLWCNTTSGMCTRGAAAGVTCGPTPSGSVQCAPDLWCETTDNAVAGVCQPLGATGAPCLLASCQNGLHCVGSTFGVTSTYGTCAGPTAEGGACLSLTDCVTGLHCENEVCVGPAALGGPCGETSDCQSGLTCANAKCLNARYPGDPCGDAQSTCVLSRCVGTSCQNLVKVDGPCTADADCAANACLNGTCADTSVCSNP
jgi:hypothetical protein